MSTKNDVTGDSIRSKAPSDKYRDNYDRIFKKKDFPTNSFYQQDQGEDMGLGFNDGFPNATEFWNHWCPSEDGWIGTEKGYPCNWCGLTEEDLDESNI
jgi:hypothetical protein